MACCTTEVKTFWTNHQEGFLFVIQHLLKIFQCKISTNYNCHRSYLFQPIISKLFDLQVEFKTLTIELDGSKVHNLLWNQISSKFNLVEDLTISSINGPLLWYPMFEPIFTSWPREIRILDSDWFTLETLLSCTCSKITLEWSNLGNKDLDEVLKNWKAGGFPNLKELKIDSEILEMYLRDLDGKVIQTDDGLKKATIRNNFGITEMSVTSF
ncbi:hypothetical protein GCK72_002981 [Caenorhabditis remanei]|uniref:Sdz-33 F-box domain-containing protein n=1 Tax=Caenorhabditis remanei TaxID=31234 RepID=A0A6A5HU95_CAERE|nr:hypothetical protein GCK72_002981 [Caenorhabditis remanei]KAF1771155.1 hypothetical protein GCK72_002981 [Caenorhabditis remanei]